MHTPGNSQCMTPLRHRMVPELWLVGRSAWSSQSPCHITTTNPLSFLRAMTYDKTNCHLNLRNSSGSLVKNKDLTASQWQNSKTLGRQLGCASRLSVRAAGRLEHVWGWRNSPPTGELCNSTCSICPSPTTNIPFQLMQSDMRVALEAGLKMRNEEDGTQMEPFDAPKCTCRWCGTPASV